MDNLSGRLIGLVIDGNLIHVRLVPSYLDAPRIGLAFNAIGLTRHRQRQSATHEGKSST
jgi:hypothetical protein